MKKVVAFTYLFLLLSIYAISSKAQIGIISTVAGTPHVAGFSGDGGPATSAQFRYPEAVIFDATNNMYVTDYINHRIRKVSPTGIISTFAGTGISGFTGDGGPATAARLFYPVGLAVDGSGNIYFADASNNRIRKITPSGIITTVAGNGSTSFSGDGGPATAAAMHWPCGVAVDGSGNIYIADFDNNRIRKVNTSGVISTFAGVGTVGYSGDGSVATAAQLHRPYGVTVSGGDIYIADYANHVIRKVNTSNIITTFAGTGVSGFSGDGGPATAARFDLPQGIVFDGMGNSYVVDMRNQRIRRISASGIISTVAGNGIGGYSGDGGYATLAQLDSPAALAFDGNNNLYIPEFGNQIVRKIRFAPDHTSDSFSVYISSTCISMEFIIVPTPASTATSVETFFGDGTNSTSAITSGSVFVTHPYANSGTYTIRHILYNGTSPIDSLSYSRTFMMCNAMPIKLYYDGNSNCVKDGTEGFLLQPSTIEVDSNGVPIDTISCTSGFYYNAYGSLGDVYAFKSLILPTGMSSSCPSTGIIYDTINSTSYSSPEKMFAIACSSSTSFDLGVNVVNSSASNMQLGHILADNTHCIPTNATVTLRFSPKYVNAPSYSHPTATTSSGNVITWNLTGLSNHMSSPINIDYRNNYNPSTGLLTVGDTVHTHISITPIISDDDTTNNNIVIIDTVTGPFDPNEISVKPKGCLPPSVANLEYTVHFENMGNDTAVNIYVLDTLPNELNAASMNIVAASAEMYVSSYRAGGHTIMRFDFPDINLPDSTHHGLNGGTFIFNIDRVAGLSYGTLINNRVGIYFDYNDVVLTNTATNVIGCPTTLGSVLPDQKLVHLYPNPASNQLTIQTGQGAYSSFSVANSMGQVLIQQPMSVAQTNVDVKMLPAGLYYVTVRGEAGTRTMKFVKAN